LSDLKLDAFELGQPGITKLRAHLQRTLDELRVMNDTSATEAATATTRGRIQEVKSLLALVTPQRPE
jgi:hypothetical protein